MERTKDEVGGTEQVYSTNEGDVLLSVSGTGVFIGEGFDLALARKLRDPIVSMQPEGPIQQAVGRMRDEPCAFDCCACLLRLVASM